jgi:protein TonB
MEKRLNFRLIYSIFLTVSVLVLILNTSDAKNLLPGDEQYVLAADKMPEPVGGIAAIMKKIEYPEAAKKSNTQGKIYLLVYVNESGSVDDVKVVKGIGNGCDEEAIKVIKNSKFTPAANGGSPVKAKLSLSLSFKL